MPSNNNKGKVRAGAKTGLGLAALAATAAGVYYFYGSKDAAKHRRALRGWVVKAKGEVIQRMEKMQNISKETYGKVVDQVLTKYQAMKEISPSELAALGRELKGYWNNIKKEAGMAETAKVPAKSRSRTRKTAGTAAKSSAKK